MTFLQGLALTVVATVVVHSLFAKILPRGPAATEARQSGGAPVGSPLPGAVLKGVKRGSLACKTRDLIEKQTPAAADDAVKRGDCRIINQGPVCPIEIGAGATRVRLWNHAEAPWLANDALTDAGGPPIACHEADAK